MNKDLELQLDQAQIAALSSLYIDEGVKKDAWKIDSVDISGKHLKARISMRSFFVSPTDTAGFHLTIFSTQEFLAQLANIYIHLYAGFEKKSRETWMRECTITSHDSIRNPEGIVVEMEFISRKKLGDTYVTMVKARVFDDQGGLFTARLKGLLR